MTSPPTDTTSIQFVNAIFYKTPHITDATWDTAYMYEFNQFFHDALATTVELGGGRRQGLRDAVRLGSATARPTSRWRDDPPYVTDQAARRSGGGAWSGTFANYTYDNLETFDYGPYHGGNPRRIQARSRRRRPAPDPGGSPSTATTGAKNITASTGFAMDNQAVRVVRWKT